MLHPFEIQGINYEEINIPEVNSGMPWGAICVTVPAFSIGYFTMGINPDYGKLSDPEFSFILTPNPSSDEINLQIQSGPTVSSVQIFSITGDCLLSQEVIGFANIDISGFPSGIYMISVSNIFNQSLTKKFIKTK